MTNNRLEEIRARHYERRGTQYGADMAYLLQLLDARPAVAALVDDMSMGIAVDYERRFTDAVNNAGKYRPEQTVALAQRITTYANQRAEQAWREGVIEGERRAQGDG